MGQDCSPNTALLHEVTPVKFRDTPVDLQRILANNPPKTKELCVIVVRDIVSLKGVHQRAHLSEEVECLVRCVPLQEEPLKQLVIREPGNRLLVTDGCCQPDSDPGVPTGKLGDTARINS